MSEAGKKALRTIFEHVDEMSDFQQGRFIGMAEMLEEQNKKEGDKKNDEQFGRDSGYRTTD